MSSSDDTSSTDYSTDSSDEDGLETALICGTKLQLPQGLCEKREIFEEFFTVDLWNSFSDDDKEHLQSFLPNFPEDDDLEKTKTLQRLFDFENFRFSNPLIKFYEHLKAGYFRPDIAQMRKVIHRAEKKEAKYRYRSFREQLKNEVIESQEKHISQIRTLPPGVEIKQEKRKLLIDYVPQRTKKRYFQILSSIKAKTDDTDVSSDENYPEGPPPPLSRKQKRHLNSIRNHLNNAKERMFGSTMVAKLNGFSIDLEKYVVSHYNPFYVNDESYKALLYHHKKRKFDSYDDQELNIEGISITDVINRTQLPFIKNLQSKSPQSDTKNFTRKRPKKELFYRKSPDFNKINSHFVTNHSSNSDSDSDSIVESTVSNLNTITKRLKTNKVGKKISYSPPIKDEIKSEPMEVSPLADSQIHLNISNTSSEKINPAISSLPNSYSKISQIKMEDLEAIDIMNTPIELDSSDIDIMGLNIKPELMQDTHTSYFSLVRDIICSTSEHRMNMYTLQERLKAWQENPISPLNDWYNLVDNWINILPSAITFLCGNASEQPDDFVPYMEYKQSLDVYQWIGAGRDSDQLLSTLCSFWLKHRTENKLVSPTEIDIDIADRDTTPPPPRCPTTWTVRKATPEEIRDYREQERRRYDNPHKAFTYRCNGYESVVGPLKGIYNPASANTKARGHTMLNANRPNFVTILSLVRDATARLPNGEGTRSDICELLKSSQYISNTAPDNILQSVVSGALDRMHTQWDPCVKYDQKKKIWIYLHRHRTEDDFERIHQHYQGVQKIKKSARKSPAKPKTTKTEKTMKVTKQQSHKVVPISASKLNTISVSIPEQIDGRDSSNRIEIEDFSDIKQEVVEAIDILDVVETNVKQSHSTESVIVTSSATLQKPKTVRRQSLLQTKISNSAEDKMVVVSLPSLVSTNQKATSLLLSNNLSKQQLQEPSQSQSPTSSPLKSQSLIKQSIRKDCTDQDSTELVQISGSVGVLKTKGQMVKIVSPSQGKSVIIPTSNPQILKQIQEKPIKGQQFIQGIALQSKQKSGTKLVDISNTETIKQVEKSKQSVNIQQVLQSNAAQNVKNMTLLRPHGAVQNLQLASMNVRSTSETQQSLQNIVTVAVSKGMQPTESVQIKTPGNLTPAQTQQILQTIKQKYLPNTNLLTSQQQIIFKQKTGLVQVQKQTSLQKPDSLAKSTTAAQGPVVAKVLTNAAGQVISVENLLAHQKTHGTLPPGTTLRVQGTKSGQQNIIHLTSSSKANAVAQFTVGTQNNIVTLTTQPKLVVASQTSTVTTVTSARTHTTRTVTTPRTQPSKITSSVNHLMNSKIITSEGQKIVQPKLVMGQSIKVPTKTGGKAATMSANSLRMVNAANLNLTTIDGKPVLLASKSGTIQGMHNQNVILQTHQSSSGSSLVLQPSTKKASVANQGPSSPSINVLNSSGNIVFTPPTIKNQLSQQVILSNQQKATSSSGPVSSQNHIVLGGQSIRLQTSNASGSQRVVLASQGQGGQILAQQILLPAGFQGTAINIKSLQGVKVIPIAQTQGKGGQSRQIFAKVMSPSIIKQSPQASTVKLQETLTINSSESD
ncbi:uncharacterized protein LOC143194432 [Rhynchophorus ferrugineus]|uniref:uncharacterized protein LOC143194432 n=1 Tax=Rhynchophorus ferrugineus TaxID=354439 RepID=UPI003FCCAAB2